MERHSYRAPLGGAGDVIVLAFLAGVVVLMAMDYPVGSYTLLWSAVFLIPAFIVGWLLTARSRARIAAADSAAAGDSAR